MPVNSDVLHPTIQIQTFRQPLCTHNEDCNYMRRVLCVDVGRDRGGANHTVAASPEFSYETISKIL